MKLRTPSPAMVVAVIALVMATSGTAVAAVNYARNSGAVDGRSAVTASASLDGARGKLVATARGGPESGRIPGKFLADVTRAEVFGRAFDVTDNTQGAPFELASADATDGIGALTVSCGDQSAVPSVENPVSRVNFRNVGGAALNLVRRTGVGEVRVLLLAPGTGEQFQINGSQTFEIQAEVGGRHLSVEGAVRQDGAGGSAASCLAFGTVELVR